MLATAIAHITSTARARGLGVVADVGCGKLRHFHILRRQADKLVLVDIKQQLEAPHTDGDLHYTVGSFVANHQGSRHRIKVLPADRFETTRLHLDVAFSVAVFDVVPAHVRRRISKSIARNLRKEGLFVLVIPRNDSSILRRCGKGNRKWDGHWFANRDGYTFYRNFRDTQEVTSLVERSGMKLEADLSRYRQVCLIFRKTDGESRGRFAAEL